MRRNSDIDVPTEEIVLLDPAGRAVGTAPKVASHHSDTPFHLAFSCYLIDEDGRVLITQRAHEKLTFPSVWTNSCCGHPAPGETLREAVWRRVQTELGVTVTAMALMLPEFTYRAVAANGVVEHERCPVVRAGRGGGRTVARLGRVPGAGRASRVLAVVPAAAGRTRPAGRPARLAGRRDRPAATRHRLVAAWP